MFKAGDVLLDRDGKVTKVLVVDDGAVHVRLYEGTFANADAVLAALQAKNLKWSIGHAPMSAEALEAEGHTTVTNAPVTEEELEGYRVYRASTQPKDEGFMTKFWRMFGGST